MPRYDEMDEILQRVRTRLTGERLQVPHATGRAFPTLNVPLEDQMYPDAVAAMQRLLADAEGLCERLHADGVRGMTPSQHEHLVLMLAKVQAQLRRCEEELNHGAFDESGAG